MKSLHDAAFVFYVVYILFKWTTSISTKHISFVGWSTDIYKKHWTRPRFKSVEMSGNNQCYIASMFNWNALHGDTFYCIINIKM